MKPQTSCPIKPGTHVMVVRSDDPLLPVGAVGITTGPYQPMLATGLDGVIKTAWVYPCDFPHYPPRPGSSGWCGLHGSIIPVTPGELPAAREQAEPRIAHAGSAEAAQAASDPVACGGMRRAL